MGDWLLRSFAEHMNCQRPDQDIERWHYIHQLTHIRPFLEQPQQLSPNEGGGILEPFPASLENLEYLLGVLREILVPFGIPDPVVALECSLGTAAFKGCKSCTSGNAQNFHPKTHTTD